MPPHQVADIVFKAIRGERFYILSHPQWKVELAQKNVPSKVGEQPIIDAFACSKATGLLYCSVEWNRIMLTPPPNSESLAR